MFIIGSGMTFHNLRAFRDPRAAPVAETFDAWLRETMTLDASSRNRAAEGVGVGARGTRRASARGASDSADGRLPVPPVTIAAVVAFNDTFTGLRLSAYHFGVN